MRSLILLTALFFSGCASVQRQPPLTRADVVQMAQAGEPPARIIERLQSTGTVLFLSASDILEMNGEGVPPQVLDWLQYEQVLEIRRRDAFNSWAFGYPYTRCAGWPVYRSGRTFIYPHPFGPC